MNVCGKRKALPPISGAENPMGNSKPTRQRRTADWCVCVCVCVCIGGREEERAKVSEYYDIVI